MTRPAAGVSSNSVAFAGPDSKHMSEALSENPVSGRLPRAPTMVTTNAAAPSAESRAPGWRTRRPLVGMAYATPTAVIVGVFFLVPLALVLWMSLHQWPLIGEPAFNAPANYAGISRNPLFMNAVWFTLKYTVIVTVILFGSALGLALLVQRRRPGVGLFRTAFFLPGAVGFA